MIVDLEMYFIRKNFLLIILKNLQNKFKAQQIIPPFTKKHPFYEHIGQLQ